MSQTMSEKILAKASGLVSVRPGDVVWAKVQTLSMADNTKYLDFFERTGLKVWDPARILFCFDHFMYSSEGLGVVGLPKIRKWARKHGLPESNIYDIGRHGLSHQIPAEEGYVLPGTVYAASDTQGATMGGLNCFAIASLESTSYLMATGDIWLKVPECLKIVFRGHLRKGVLGKDIYLRLLSELAGRAQGRVLEIVGPGIESIPIDVRLAVANGANHLGAMTFIFGADRELHNYLRPRAKGAYETVEPDKDAEYVSTHEYDLRDFEPLVAGPDRTSRIRPVGEVTDVRIDAAYIGSCSSGRMEDLRQAAEILKDKTIKQGVRLVVTPISSRVAQDASLEGLLGVLAKAGATITAPGCGACFYGNQSPLLLDDGEVCITGSTENYPGRMGSEKAKIYLGSAAVIAASALEGRIADPTKYLTAALENK